MTDIKIIPPELLALMTADEKQEYEEYLIRKARDLDEWDTLVPALFPETFTGDFAEHHCEFWEWLWGIEPAVRPNPFIGVWSRGHGKSSTVEAAVATLGARGKRAYCLYISDSQDQADDHVANIAALLESSGVAAAYTEFGMRAVNKYGQSKGWKRNRIRTQSGFTVDAIGFDTAARGVKLENQRPDIIVLDDIDGEHDTLATTRKKIRILTRKFLPSGSNDCVIIAIQNLILGTGIFARLSGQFTGTDPEDQRVGDFLRGRQVSGPIPAIKGLTYEDHEDGYVITGGEATWPGGKPLEVCQQEMNDYGISSFLAECQHESEEVGGDMFDHLDWSRFHVGEADLPRFKRTVCWVDPAVTSTDRSDNCGVIIDGQGMDGRIYRLFAWEGIIDPLAVMKLALKQAVKWNCETLGVETNQGGDLWQNQYRYALESLALENDSVVKPGVRIPRFRGEKASTGTGGKVERARQMLFDYERPDHVKHLKGACDPLERALFRFPKTKPYDLVDASWWGWNDVSSRLMRHRTKVTSARGQTVGDIQIG